jgi:hypothetical protein
LALASATAKRRPRSGLYAGGWVDADYLPAGEQDVICEYVEVDHADEAGPLLDRIVAALTDT